MTSNNKEPPPPSPPLKRKLIIAGDTDSVNEEIRLFFAEHSGITVVDVNIKKDCDSKVGIIDYYYDDNNDNNDDQQEEKEEKSKQQ